MKMKRVVILMSVGIILFPIVIGIVSAISNSGLPTHSQVVAQLNDQEKARLTEFFHLRQTLGDAAWPEWGEAAIPVIVYNESYAFLVGYPDPNPPDGWVKVPQNELQGGPWEPVPDDTFDGRVYYRQRLPVSGETPQAFTVRVGEHWAASLQTKEWMAISLTNQLRADLPAPLAPIFPYRLAVRLLSGGSDLYVALLAHESFHAYQGVVAPERLAAAETAVHQENNYPWDAAGLQAAWQTELDLLRAALATKSEAETADLAQQFLNQRQQRRQEFGLDGKLADYERQREWLEGLAKYVELEIWQQAAAAPGYEPADALVTDPDFAQYAGFEKRWSQEIAQMGRMADDEGDGRFYYSGVAQAALLDKLTPGWKERGLAEGIFLEDLLETAVVHR